MKAFISFSGKTSKHIAEELKTWLQTVIQEVEVFYSEEDIEKGSRWRKELADKLEEFSFGLACITPDNLGEEWIAFESGALSKNLDNSKVIPILFGGLEKNQLQGPLTQFDVATFNKEGMWKVVKAIFENMEESTVDKATVKSTFESFWPDLDENVTDILEGAEGSEEAEPRSEKEMLKEVLELTRYMNQRREVSGLGPDRVDNLREDLRAFLGSLIDKIGGMVEMTAPASDTSTEDWEKQIKRIIRLLDKLNMKYELGHDIEIASARMEKVISDKKEEQIKDEDEEIPF